MNIIFPSRLLSLSVFVSLISSILYSQEHGEVYRYARKIVDTLASPSMHGRGYVNDGEKIAASYLEGEFKKSKLISFNDNFRQKFVLNVNTFPGKMELEYPTRDMYTGAGAVFLVDPACPSIKGTFKLIKADSLTIKSESDLIAFRKNKFKNKFLYVDTTRIRNSEVKKRIASLIVNPPKEISGLIICEDWFRSPTQRTPGPWDVSQIQSKLPFISCHSFQVDSTHMDKVELDIQAKFIRAYQTQNLIGYIKGSVKPDSFLVFTAHYDHLGQMGKDTYFPGANDNASGCAMLLNLAKYYSMPEHKPAYSIAFMAFGAEEAGLVGSKYYTEHPLFPLKQIKFLVNLDIMGTGDEGVTVVNGSIYPDAFKALKSINDKEHFLPLVKIRGKAANSDHYWFSEKGVPSFFIYTMGGIKAYHDIDDKAETLPLTKFEDVFRLLTGFADSLQMIH
jgi:aminopeptidase YwaD